MSHTNLDIDVLRSFATGIAMGSFAQAADKLGRSTSAVSAQLKKLESQTGTTLLRKAGRGLELTDAGEALLAYAHRLLELNDEAVAAMRASELQGVVRLGLPEDFGECLLPMVLGRFARAHPRVQIQVSVGRGHELLAQYESGALDLMLRWELGAQASAKPGPGKREIMRQPLRWIGPAADNAVQLVDQPWYSLIEQKPRVRLRAKVSETQPWQALPMVFLAEPCPMRPLIVDALNRQALPWRPAFVSGSLAASWAAVASGLGLAVRTSLGLPPQVRVIGAEDAPGLPALPSMALVEYCQTRQPQVLQLAEIFDEVLKGENF